MSRLRSHLSPRIVLALSVIVLGGSLIAFASSASLSVSRTELGTSDPATLSSFALNWLHNWQVNQTINGDLVPARPNIQSVLIDPWLAASGGKTLDMKKAPLRLLAIVARLDLRQNAGYSGGTTAGEARFIYNVLLN